MAKKLYFGKTCMGIHNCNNLCSDYLKLNDTQFAIMLITLKIEDFKFLGLKIVPSSISNGIIRLVKKCCMYSLLKDLKKKKDELSVKLCQAFSEVKF